MNVTNDASVNRAVQQALERTGRIDVVVNNAVAGIAAAGVTEAYTVEQFQQVLEVNLPGVVRVKRAVLPTMRHQRSGLLIHVSSGVGMACELLSACACRLPLRRRTPWLRGVMDHQDQ
jgi:NADP-dependent 3-hydroxy acid dehydrogenase YdfG